MWAVLLVALLAPERAVAESEAKAEQALREGQVAEALDAYEEALRAASTTAEKLRLRDCYRKAGWAEPRPVNQAEQMALDIHVRNERIRVLTRAAEAMEGKDELHAAIILRRALTEMKGGPDSDGGRAEQDKIRSMIRKLTENPSDEDKERVAQVQRAHKTGPGLLKAARRLLEERQFRVVVRICQEMMFGEFDQEVQNEAIALRHEAEETAANDIPAAQKEAALHFLTDERFERLEVQRSRHFLFLGPQEFVRAIPDDQKTLLDLAYIFQSDLADQPLTADGVRIVLYYQETFDFGGGLAGGKIIRIGNRAIRLPVAGMLHYHELGHCIFGRGWLHNGFTEGLADFAAGFTLDLLGQTAQAQQFVTDARDQFVRYYCGRAVRYFDIQPYRPSAGFLFNFLPPGEAPFDWAPYRRVFHRMREAQFGSWPEREHQLMRYFGYLLSTEYGPRTLDLLAEWGWPVERADEGRVRQESEGILSDVKRGEFLLSRAPDEAETLFREVLRRMPEGEVAARARFGLLQLALTRRDDAVAARRKAELGIVDAFLLAGPFHARGQTAYVVMPPETRIDLSQPVRYGFESAAWKEGKIDPSGYVDLRDQGYGYPEGACAFALAWVHLDREAPARLWVGSDDGHTLYVNNELVEKRATNRGFRLDDDFTDATFRAGWNRILLKVHNGGGPWGFLLRVTDREGRPLTGARFTTEDEEARVPRFETPKTKAVGLVNDEFKGGLSTARWLTTVGSFDTQNGRLRPRGTEKHGLWQRFIVDPDHPKDGPANIMWLQEEELARADSFELEMVVAAGAKDGLPAKFGLTIDGENENDGQSGHTLVFDTNDGKLRCHWYRYDQLLYLQPGVEVAPAPLYRLRLVRHGSKWWLSVNDVALFEEVDAPRLPAFGVGVLSWGRGPEIESFRLARLEPAPAR